MKGVFSIHKVLKLQCRGTEHEQKGEEKKKRGPVGEGLYADSQRAVFPTYSLSLSSFLSPHFHPHL